MPGQHSGGPPPIPPGYEFVVNKKLDPEERLVGHMPGELAAYLSAVDWGSFVGGFNDAVDQGGRRKPSSLTKMGQALTIIPKSTTTLRRDAIPALLHDRPGLNPMLRTKGLMAQYWYDCETEHVVSGKWGLEHDRHTTYQEYTHFVRFLTLPATAAATT